MSITLREINIPVASPTYRDVINNGHSITPQQHILLYSDKEWEVFTEECTHSMKQEYHSVRRAGGAGDQGIDIAGFRTDNGFSGGWDNYQCKHYNKPLAVADIYLELGKLCYYTFIGEYTLPDNYYFVAPHGVSTSLSKHLRSANDELRQLLIKNWKQYCEKKNNINKTN